jgi:hypothetical protein
LTRGVFRDNVEEASNPWNDTQLFRASLKIHGVLPGLDITLWK